MDFFSISVHNELSMLLDLHVFQGWQLELDITSLIRTMTTFKRLVM